MKVHNINKNNSYSDTIALEEKHFGDYYFLDDIINNYPDFGKIYHGRRVLQNYEFNKEDYNFVIYSPNKNKNYKFYNESYCLAKLFIKREWVEKNVINAKKDYIEPPKIFKFDNAPEFLKNGENSLKFRGEKSREKLLISVESVAGVLEINKNTLRKNVINGTYNLENNYHFVLCGFKEGNKLIKKPYFTYTGFITYIFMTRSPNAHKILTFCETVLFNSMFGTSEEKTEMVLANIIKTPEEVNTFKKKLGVAISESVQTTSILGKISCLYLLIFEERKSTYVVKFGLTDDLNRRMSEHKKVFGNVYIKICRYIDEKELHNAENELHTFFKKNYTPVTSWPENDKTVRKEVFEIRKGKINDIIKLYNELSEKYGNKVADVNNSLKNAENKIEQEKKDMIHKYELICKDKDNKILLLEKDIEQQKKSYEKDIEHLKTIMNQKDESFKEKIENLNLKLEMANLKLSIFSK